MALRWLLNTNNPYAPDAYSKYFCSFIEDKFQSWQHHLDWLKDKIIGEPQGTDYYTCEQLKNMGMVGVYDVNEEIVPEIFDQSFGFLNDL